jgi:osmoprotectant transport system permease protein
MSLPGQVIPNFSGPNCTDQFFCWDWIGANWSEVLQPALIQHIWISALAVIFGLVISVAAALYAVRNQWFERGFSALATFLYTIPALAFFLLMVPITGLNVGTVLIGLTSYTLLLLFANAVTGLRATPPETIAAADGMGLTRNQVLFKVQLPLALPSIMAGVRIAVVTVISLETVAAQVVKAGLGNPLFDAQRNVFTTGLITTGLLAIILALVADGLVVLLQRAVTPWVQARR